MKTLCLLLSICLIGGIAAAQSRSGLPSDAVTEKRYVTLIQTDDASPYLLNTTNGNLWRLDPVAKEWLFLGSPRSSNSRRKGGFQLLPYKPGEVLILDVDSGRAWWTDDESWLIIKEPSTRRTPTPPASYL